MASEILANRYRVLGPLGEGAMGIVWLVEDTTDGRQVALKAISRTYGTSDKSVLQFKQEFRLMTQLRHPNCCEVYDYGVLESGEPFFTMEVVPGHGLDERVPLSGGDFRNVMAQLALALGYIHQLGFVHRDLKAANVRVTPEGVVKLMDYGLMEHAGRADSGINGTVPYLAPEVIKRLRLDRRADLYSLGCLAYEALVGHTPFRADRVVEVLRAHVEDKPRPPSSLRADIAPDHERLVMALLAKEPFHRPPSARDVLDALGIEPPAGLGGNLLGAPLLDREAELATIEGAIAEALAGGAGRCILFYGQEGVGKTRIADEARFRAQLAGMPCGVGGFAQHALAPYETFVQVLRGLLPALRTEVPEALAVAAPVLVKVLPELAIDHQDLVPAPFMDAPSKEKARLQAAIAEVLTALAWRRPTALILEDWHLVDPLGEQLLGTLRRVASAAPLLIFLTSTRREEGDREWIQALEQIPLGPLRPDGVRRMLAAMLGLADVEPAFVAEVAKLTDGNPFFVEKLLDHLVKSGDVHRVTGGWGVPSVIGADRVPRNLDGLLSEKLAGLSEGALTMARIGALLGQTFEVALLEQVANYTEEELFEALEVLQQQQIFQRAGDQSYRFAHEHFRSRLYADLPADERVFMHGLVVYVLVQRLGDSPRAEAPLPILTAIATHAIGAGDADATVAFALIAGQRHLELASQAEAERFLEAGLAATQNQIEWLPERQRYLALLGDLRRLAGQHEAALGLYEQAIALATSLDDEGALPRLLTSQAKAATNANDLGRAAELTERAVLLAESQERVAELTRALLAGSRARMYLGQLPEALGYAMRGLETARARGGPFEIGEALAECGMIHVRLGGAHMAPGIADLDEAVEMLETAGDKTGLANALITLGDARLAIGALGEAQAAFVRSRALNQQLAMPVEEAFALLNLAVVAYELGQPAETVASSQEVHTLGVKFGLHIVITLSQMLEACARAWLGDLGAAYEQGTRALEQTRGEGNKYLESLALPYYMDLLLTVGRASEALEAGKTLNALIETTGARELAGPLDVALALAHCQLGDAVAAYAAAERALAVAREIGSTVLTIRALRAKAAAAILAASPAKATEYASEALTLAQASGLDMLRLELLALLGEAALGRGLGDARVSFAEMATLAARLELPVQLALAKFGLAASDPHSSAAADWVGKATSSVESLLATLDAQGKAAFAERPDIKRLLGKDHVTFGRSLPGEEAPKARAPGLEAGLRRLF